MCVLSFFLGSGAANLGTFVGGFSTLFAIIVAIIQFHKWKDQDIEREKARVAFRALIAIRKVHGLMKNFSSKYIEDLVKDGDSSTRSYRKESFREFKKEFLQDHGHDVKDFESSIIESEIYLSKEIQETLQKILQEWNQIQASLILISISEVFEGIPSTYSEKKDQVFGEAKKNERDSMLQKAQSLLMPIAHFKR